MSKILNHKSKAEKRTQELKAANIRKFFKKVLSKEPTSIDNSSDQKPKSEALVGKIIAKVSGSVVIFSRKINSISQIQALKFPLLEY